MIDHHQDFRQPDMIEVKCVVAKDNNEDISKLAPDQTIQGREWAIYYTLSHFDSLVLTAQKIDKAKYNSAIVFEYWAYIVQGCADTLWNVVIKQHTMS